MLGKIKNAQKWPLIIPFQSRESCISKEIQKIQCSGS